MSNTNNTNNTNNIDNTNLANLRAHRRGPRIVPQKGRARWAAKQEALAARNARVSASRSWWDSGSDTDLMLLYALPTRLLSSVRSADDNRRRII
jgi:hypothetical protein